MKKLIIITLLISTLAVTGCGVGTVNSIAPSSSDTVSINTLSDSDILKNAESTNNNDFSGYNIIACEASSADRTISDSLEDISGNSTLVINHLDGTQDVPEEYEEISFVCLRPDGCLELSSTLGECETFSVNSDLEGLL